MSARAKVKARTYAGWNIDGRTAAERVAALEDWCLVQRHPARCLVALDVLDRLAGRSPTTGRDLAADLGLDLDDGRVLADFLGATRALLRCGLLERQGHGRRVQVPELDRLLWRTDGPSHLGAH